MNSIEIAMLTVFMLAQGIMIGYIIWAPATRFKQGFIDGLSLKFLWGKK